MSVKRFELVLDYFDNTLHAVFFSRDDGYRVLGASTIPLRAGPSKAICTEALRQVNQEIDVRAQGQELGITLSVHGDVRNASYAHHEMRLAHEAVITPSVIQSCTETFGIKRGNTSSFSLLEVNGYPTKAPLSKIGSSIGCTVSTYSDTEAVVSLRGAIMSVYSHEPTIVFFPDRCISMLPTSFTPYTLFVIGKHMSEYSVVREGCARESIFFEWGTELIGGTYASAPVMQVDLASEQAEQFWGAISKTTSQLPMPSEYVTIAYTSLDAAPLIESIMSGVYTGTGAPMRPKKGALSDACASLHNAPEARAKLLLDSISQFSFL